MKFKKGNEFLPKTRKTGPVKYLCICANPTDCEIMAIDGIQRGYRAKKYTFACAITSDGASVPRSGKYAEYSDGQMRAVLTSEAKKAAELGRYNSLYFLKYSDEEVRDQESEDLVNDYIELIKNLKPRIIYTHSILDLDPTHLSVAVKVINACRKLKKGEQPKIVYGCELYRDLDWIEPSKLVTFNISKNIRLQKQLISIYKSQLECGKDFVKASIGRRYAVNTFTNPKKINENKLSSRAINMTTLLRRKDLPIKKYAMSFVEDLYGSINDAMDIAL